MDENVNKNEVKANGKLLLGKFAGENYEGVLKNKFSIPAFFLGGCYFIYRKLYTIGIALCVGTCIAAFAIPDKTFAAVIILALSLYAGSDFLNQYTKFAKQKITEILADKENREERIINEKISKAGGTDIKMAIIIPVVLSVVFGIIFQGIA